MRKTNKHRTQLNLSKVRKHNNFLRNWANRTESAELVEIILSHVIILKRGKAILKGI